MLNGESCVVRALEPHERLLRSQAEGLRRVSKSNVLILLVSADPARRSRGPRSDSEAESTALRRSVHIGPSMPAPTRRSLSGSGPRAFRCDPFQMDQRGRLAFEAAPPGAARRQDTPGLSRLQDLSTRTPSDCRQPPVGVIPGAVRTGHREVPRRQRGTLPSPLPMGKARDGRIRRDQRYEGRPARRGRNPIGSSLQRCPGVWAWDHGDHSIGSGRRGLGGHRRKILAPIVRNWGSRGPLVSVTGKPSVVTAPSSSPSMPMTTVGRATNDPGPRKTKTFDLEESEDSQP